MKKEFDLQWQYQFYLEKVKLKEINMGETQRKEMKRTFMGACGIVLILLKDELASLPDDEAMTVLENMLKQVGDYYNKQTK